MSSESRQATGASGKAKRRLADPDDDGKTNTQDDPAQPKRQRVSRACDSCRSKKDKCDGLQPVCSTCASLGRPCTYKANPKKRGLPTGYIRSLELLWGLVFQKIQGSEDVMRALMRSINLPSHLATMGKEAEGSDTLLSSFKNSTVLRDIERMLVILEQPEEERERSLQAYGDGDTPLDVDAILASSEANEWQIPEGLEYRETPFTGISPSRVSMINSAPRPPGYRTRESGVQTVSEHAHSPPLGLSLNARESQMNSCHNLLQLPSNAWPLLDIYFSYTQCWFPILEKHDILRTAYQYAEGDVSMSCTAPSSGDHAALWAVLALASFQENSTNAAHPAGPQADPHINPLRMYNTARDLIPSEIGPYELGHVQAILILSLIKFGQQQWTAAWMLVGHAVRIAQTLGLDRPSFTAPSRSPEKQLGRAKHVFLGCFVLETLIAEHTLQCPSLRKDDLARVGPISEDGLEEWHPWEDQTSFRPTQSSRASMQRGPLHALSTFNRLVSLVSILNDLCFYMQDPTISRSQLESLELQLQRWVSALPKSCRVQLENRPVKLPSPHIFGLEMTYQSIVAALSLQIASRESDQHVPAIPHKGKAIESTKRVLNLVHVFIETYSFSATAPTLGMILGYCLPSPVSRSPVSDIEMGLRAQVESLASNLRQLWITQDRSHAGQASLPRTQPQQLDIPPPSETPALQHPIMPVSTPRHLISSTDLQSTQNESHLPPPEPFLSTPWLRSTQGIDENGPLIHTPTPSMTTVGGASEASAQPGQLDGLRQSSTSAPSKSQNMIPDFPPSFPSGGHYSTYQDPSLNIPPFVDMDGYGPARRQQPQRIAPDLDALFDELASLDGAEKPDNQPEFMQNLGFVAENGVPELFSFSSQIEPFLLAQTQQLPGSAPPSSVRHDSLSISGTPKR
ncbi:Quinic acid utilization activator [Penicillium rolfsii]|nr:Quinic acid utilization activator [Penicillium rolfsii]